VPEDASAGRALSEICDLLLSDGAMGKEYHDVLWQFLSLGINDVVDKRYLEDTVRAFLRNPKSGSANPQDWTNW
jgi:hypothetical protein